MNTMIPIAETFVSLQGEGKLTGTPSWFVRLSGCNLRCTWCDTPYASWRPEATMRSVEDLVDEAQHAVWESSPVRHVVVTGGEPMMFAQTPTLTHALRDAGMHVTIETAGTIVPLTPLPVHADLMSISPKLASSTPTSAQAVAGGFERSWAINADGGAGTHERRRLNEPVLQRLLNQFGFGRRQLKFVVTGERDLAEIDSLLARLHGWSDDDVLLMPEGITVPTAQRRAWLEGVCAARGWTYCRRLHIELFGNRRGT